MVYREYRYGLHNSSKEGMHGQRTGTAGGQAVLLLVWVKQVKQVNSERGVSAQQ